MEIKEGDPSKPLLYSPYEGGGRAVSPPPTAAAAGKASGGAVSKAASPFRGSRRAFTVEMKRTIEDYIDRAVAARRVSVDGSVIEEVPHASIPTYKANPTVKNGIQTSLAEILNHAKWLATLSLAEYNALGESDGIMSTKVRYTRKFIEAFVAPLMASRYDIVFDPKTGKMRSSSDKTRRSRAAELSGSDLATLEANVTQIITENSVPGIRISHGTKTVEVTRQPKHPRIIGGLPIVHSFRNYVDMVEAAFRIMSGEEDLMSRQFTMVVDHTSNDEPPRGKIKFNGMSHFFGFEVLGIDDEDTINAGNYAARYIMHRRSIEALDAATAERYQSVLALIGDQAIIRQYAELGSSKIRSISTKAVKENVANLHPQTQAISSMLNEVQSKLKAAGLAVPAANRSLSDRLYGLIPGVLQLLKPHEARLIDKSHNVAKHMLPNVIAIDGLAAASTAAGRSDIVAPTYGASYLSATGQISRFVTNLGLGTDLEGRIAILFELNASLDKMISATAARK